MILSVEGMSCGHCVRTITRAVQALDPAAQVQVDLAAGTVAAQGGFNADRLAAAITAAGYTVRGTVAA